jgi:8-oxo-dGTP diphosphatase
VKAESTNIILLSCEDSVLLYLRDDKPILLYPNMWALPGGYIEEGETPEQCILREIEEELGIKLGEVALFVVAQRSYGIEHTFWARVNFYLEDIVLTEGQAIRWFTFDEIKNTELGYEDNSILDAFFKDVLSSKGTL